ncbi:unnamed protein product, partial [Nesidiocoris tenuis]
MMNRCTRLFGASVSTMAGKRSLASQAMLTVPLPPLESLMSSENIERTINRMKEMKVAQRPPSHENAKKAAILIPLCLIKDELSLLYTLRNADLKRHKGQ